VYGEYADEAQQVSREFNTGALCHNMALAKQVVCVPNKNGADAAREGLQLYGEYLEEAKQVSGEPNHEHCVCRCKGCSADAVEGRLGLYGEYVEEAKQVSNKQKHMFTGFSSVRAAVQMLLRGGCSCTGSMQRRQSK
jgi:hypothetical protein